MRVVVPVVVVVAIMRWYWRLDVVDADDGDDDDAPELGMKSRRKRRTMKHQN